MSRRLAVLAIALAAALAVACGSPCEDLASRICSCQPAGTLRDACNQAAKNELSNGATKPDAKGEQCCQALLGTCDPSKDAFFCDTIKTQAGKENCGLAFSTSPPPGVAAACTRGP